jgi:alpha-2-macroglobulin
MKKISGALVAALQWFVQRFIHPLTVALVGEVNWSPPRWLRFLAGLARSGNKRLRQAVAEARDKNPRRFWVLVATAVFCLAGSVAGWNWYSHRPKPHKLSVSGTWPRPTRLEKDAQPDPLVIRFSGSAASLAQVGKEVKSGITATPPLEGTWDWRSDSSLVFTPKADWEVGRKYTIRFDRHLFASHVLLSSYTYEFQSPAFASSVAEAQFYDDPTSPRIKKVVATVRFTHPVDKTDFEKRIALRMRIEPVKSFDSSEAKAFGFKISYDEFGGKAFIHSDPFPIPSNEGEMLLTIDKGTHSARGGPGTREKIERTVHIPGIESYFRITGVTAAEVENEHEEVDRVATVSASAQMRQSDLDKYLSVVILPKDKPAVGDQPVRETYRWSDPLEVVPEVLKLSTPLKVEWVVTEREWNTLQSFKFAADTDRDLFVTIRQGLTSFGDYPLKKDFSAIIHAGPLQRAVKIVSEGAVLSLAGDRKLSIRTRSVDAIRLEVSRILPGNLSHLVSQSAGAFQNPQFAETWGGYRYGYQPSRDFGLDNLSEIFTEVRTFPPDPSGRNHYAEFDFSSLLSNGATPRGLFSLSVQAWNPQKKEPLSGGPADRRLVLLTDLGLVVKDSADASHDAFVQSIRTGEPVADASVSVLGKNGLAVLSAKTDVNGHVSFPTLKDFKREKTPTVYAVEKDGDLSFLPIDRNDRRLNLSRFDTGGVYSTPDSDSLQAYLFSDRGIYRPGEEIHLGMIVRTIDWKPLPEGLPLELVISDPRGIEIRRQVAKFSTVGFEEFSTATQEDSPTGPYQFGLYIKRDKERETLLGSTSVRVEEFQPDRMIIKAELSTPPSDGWIAPSALAGKVLLRNLFGTAAAGRTVKGSFKLWPSVTAFPKYAAYRFHDPYATKNSYEEQLGEVTTDADGHANFDMKLERFERGIYRLRFVAEGFEAEGGRSVMADTSAIVSPAPFLVAYKSNGDLDYLKKDSERSVHVVAVDPKLQQVATADLESELVEFRYVSVLTKQESGTFAYQSVKKEISREKKPLAIPAGGLTLKLPTAEPGSFAFVIRDAKGEELNRISFDVVGQANVSRSLEREAELKIKLGSPEVKSGDEVEVEIQAPYVGSGLITIERDRVYNAKWFTTTTTGSVQKIRVPEELEGNGYVTVTFLRSLDSKEIFMSPLSYGAVPFEVNRARHSEAVSLHVPERVRPGDRLKIGYQTQEPAKVLLIVVDEGILQVARYKTPDPLGHFFRKRALEVTTSQILDLVLPEIRLLHEASAPGGDEEGRLARHLNPFKRKGQRPVAFWSGIVDSDGKPGSIDVAIPDFFNGTVRVMAVAANERAIGVAEAKTVSQGYFVLQPQAPYFAAPGDEFEVTSLVANNGDAGGKEARVKVGLETSGNLEVIGEREQELSIPRGSDATVSFRVRARSEPGVAHLMVKASGGDKQASYALEMSIRPAAPFVTTVQSGYVQKGLIHGAKADLALERKMFPERRKIEASASSVPLGLATGLVRYLQEYPYGCTEQLVSQAFPGVVLGARPEFGLDKERVAKSFARALATLEGRQNAAGAFAVWGSGSNVSNFLSVYATHFLLEAREHGRDVPGSVVERALGFLKTFASSRATTLPELRAQAYAAYLLARNGVVVTNQLASIREALDTVAPKVWPDDLAGVYLAATYELLEMDKQARELLAHAPVAQTIHPEYDDYYDDLVYRAQYLYLTAKHFPGELPRLSGSQITALADSVVGGRSNTISSAYAILGLDAYSRAAEAQPQARLSLSEVLADKTSKPLLFENTLFARAEVSADAKAVHFESDGPQTLFYQISEAGFDLEPPTSVIKNRLEVYRELKNEKGEPTTSITLDSKIYVHVLVRALDAPVDNVAVVDLLPGGFELDISPEGLGSRVSLQAGPDAWRPTYIDAREDRVIFFGRLDTQARRFVYRLKPTNRGKFAVAPSLAEGMYERSALARSLAGSVSVEK